MKRFVIVWAGQLVSLIGSTMTTLALVIHVYQATASVIDLALVALFGALPAVVFSPLAGALVDRWDRRWVMILSDVGSGLGTLALALLLLAGRLEVWHIYVVAAAGGLFGAFQWPAYSAATTLLVPKEHLGRASGLVQTAQSASVLLGPILTGALVGAIGVEGIILIDLATFVLAVAALLSVRIPQPETSAEGVAAKGSLASESLFGWRYIRQRPGLLALLVTVALANFAQGFLTVLTPPLVLAFASPMALGTVLSIFGAGALAGGVAMGVWGGSKRRIYGLLGFQALSGLFILLTGLKPSTLLIAIGGFGYALCIPIVIGCSQAIWQTKVEPDVQGRVFGFRALIAMSSAPLAFLLAGPLAEKIFEPAMAAGGPMAGSVGQLIGTGTGRGIGLLLVAVGLLLVFGTVAAFLFPRLRDVEIELPDAVDASEPAPGMSGAGTMSESSDSS